MSIARKLLQVVAFVCTLVIGVTSMMVIVSQTTWFKEWLRGFIIRQADDYVNGRLTIGRIDGNLFFGVEMEDVDVTQNGQPVVSLKDVGVDYNFLTFLGGNVILDHIRLNEPTLHVKKTATGWNLTELIKAQTPNPTQPKSRRPIGIGEIGVSGGTLYLENQPVGTSGVRVPQVIDKIDASVGVTSDANELKVDVAHVALRARNPEFGVNDLSGVIRRHEDSVTIENLSLRTEETSLRVAGVVRGIGSDTPVINVKASSDKFDIGEMAKILPALRGYAGLQPAFEINASGPADRLDVQLNLREKQLGQVTGNLVVDGLGPERRVAGEVQTQHFNAGPLVRGATFRTDVTGHATMNLALPASSHPLNGTYSVNASRANVLGYETRDVVAKGRIDWPTITVDGSASGYGGRATAKGIIEARSPLSLDLTGQAAHVDLRNVPPQLNAPGVPSNLQFGYTLTGRGPVLSGDIRMEESTLADATIAAGTTGTFRIGDGAPEYSARGHVTNLDLQKVGHGFNIPALDTEKYQSRITGEFDVNGSGGGRYPLTLDASGTLADSEIFRATTPRFQFSTNLAGGDAHVVANGEFNGLDPSTISGDTRVAGRVNAAVDVNVTLRGYANGVTPESIDASGRVDMNRSTIGGIDIDTAVVDGTYQDRAGNLNQLVVDGPDLHVKGQGPIALNDTGTSNLALHVETPSLDRLGRLFGQPDLKGAATVDATITGNGQELKAAGMLDGSNLGKADNNALDLDSTFDVTLPQLRLADATVHAKTDATFVQLAGQQINSLTADTTYTREKLDFTAVAKQGPRQLSAEGSAVLHTDHREIHVGSLALETEKIVWKTDPASHPTVQYGDNRVVVDDIRLVNGDQRIEAQGSVGSASDTLHVKADNVDVAQLDALMLGDQRLAGRLNADATVSGTTAAPRVAGDFTLSQGAFRNFKFMSFGGKVDYQGRGMNLDVRLDQDAQSWFTAKGFAPTTLFQPTPKAMEGEHAAPRDGEAINLEVASSQIDLGVVQGFTSYVTDVTGTLQANFKITGSGYDPHVDGAIDIKGGSFVAPDLNTSFSGLDTRIDLKPDVVTINEFRILDKNKRPMTIGGSLAVHERSVGEVDIKVQSDDFKVIANKTADLKFDSDFHITGTVRAPKVEGSVEVEPGTIDVAEVLRLAGERSAYSTTATEISPAESAGPEPTTPALPSMFDALDLRLGLAIPGDLLLKGNNIKPASAPIDVGDMNAYVGGAVNIVKAPGGRLRITGEVNTVRGNYSFQGRRFDIMRDGRIRFPGSEVIDPQLDLTARRVISGIETFVHVRGSMLRPELSFSSNPPQDESDILSLIIFGAPTNELGETQQIALAIRAQELAGGYLTSGLSEAIGGALNLDEFEIQAAGENGLGPSVTVGQQVAKGLFVRLRQGFGAEQATEFILEYQLASFLRLQGTASDVSSSVQRNAFRRVERGGLDLIFFFNY
ncbi:MAG TPA: translocation/assembly module TamB domain-containing protein [Vicinamibacterales bacterium]|nr:translocation/assembly module TamB domain-containing protein [Vicinamibacterales bacterium]